MKVIWLAAIAVAMSYSLPAIAAQPVYVGVYEPEHTERAAGADSFDPATKTYHFRHGTSHIRVAFTYSDGHWRALPDDTNALAEPSSHDLQAYPAALTFQGLAKATPAVSARRGDWYDRGRLFYADVGVYELIAPPPATLLRPAKGMSDWAGTYRYAPAILTTAGGSAFPVATAAFGPTHLAALVQALRDQVPTYTVCDKPEHKLRDEPWKVRDIHVRQALRGPTGTLVELEIDSKLDRCESYDEGFPDKNGAIQCDYCSHWFLLSPDGKVRALGNAMDLLGVADLAGDGRAEWLFSQHAEGNDRYLLFADDFATRAEFSWSYH